ncbi:prephenate dehydratase [Vacuolonema iberomarrocanum]|uniref:prephenate dehydratase n=1 Tax=Vacuolonema iberomarrocanum TaxID=3454632 RepID=UPI0019FB4DFB|nr:prephenate dehydratase [filamentous cyanobacterium LEGE 07170]
MMRSIAYLGPVGTYAETAAIHWARLLREFTGQTADLCPYPSITQVLQATAQQAACFSVVPVENSIEGSVTTTLDTLWNMAELQIHYALVLPISHALISQAESIEDIQIIYSHPQAIAQCQIWIEKRLPNVTLIPTRSTTEALQHLSANAPVGAIASRRAATLYNMPTLAHPINDHPDNCTRFWILSRDVSPGGSYTSLAFSVPANVPGALVRPLQTCAQRGINLSRIESRPTKRSLGDYLFFLDLEGNVSDPKLQEALEEMQSITETLKIFGSYDILTITSEI